MHFRGVGAALAGALVLLGAMATGLAAQGRDRGDWVLLGEQTVGFRVDRDVIRIGQSEDWYRTRSFRTLHFKAEGNDVHMMTIRLVYLNGFGEDFSVDRLIRQGGELALDLRGDRSFLRQIEMVYRSRPDFRGQAVIKVFGEPARRGPPPGLAAGRDWTELGCQNVSFSVDRDTLRVGTGKGRFTAIRVHARGADVEMLDLKVIYGNGEPDDLEVRSLIKRGERTRPIDLKGADRAIDRILMVYRSVPNFRGREADICIEGLVALASPPLAAAGRDWVELGCQQVSLFGKDRDSIKVGRREGRFKAIRLHVRGADVEMLDLKVIYGNGEPDDIQVRHLIRAGEGTRPLDLKGWERAIDRVDMVYRTVPNFKGLATVCVEGLH